jgi:PAS domain S-box-containing protein
LWAMKPLAIVAPESHENAVRQIREFEARPDTPGEMQMWIIRKDGERRFVYSRISGVRHHDSFLNFIIFTDITDLKSQEERVSESEQRFRMMADNIQDGLFIVENDKVVFTNRRIKEITGYSPEEMAIKGLHGTLLTDDIQAIADCGIVPVTDKAMIGEIFRTVRPDSPAPGEFKIWIRRKDGVHRYIHGKITAALRGEITSYYIIISDITDFAEREKTLRERIDALQDLLQ